MKFLPPAVKINMERSGSISLFQRVLQIAVLFFGISHSCVSVEVPLVELPSAKAGIAVIINPAIIPVAMTLLKFIFSHRLQWVFADIFIPSYTFNNYFLPVSIVVRKKVSEDVTNGP